MSKLRPQHLRYLAYTLGVAGVVILGVITLMIVRVQEGEETLVHHDLASIHTHPFALILGATLNADGSPPEMLVDRVQTGVEAYKQGKVQRLLLTGDDGAFHTNEVKVMRQLALDQGVPNTDIFVDGHGYRTYESCKRAKTVFHITDALIVTQDFHIRRALYLCSRLGLHVEGLTADSHRYPDLFWYTLRDLLASVKAMIDINLLPPAPPVSFPQHATS